MENKILELIRESLPEKEVGIVKVVFEERETYKKDLATSKENNLVLKKEVELLDKEVVELRKTKVENADKKEALEVKEKDIAKRETKLLVDLAENEVRVIKDCFDKVMKVPQIRKTIYKNVTKDSYNNGAESENGGEEITEE